MSKILKRICMTFMLMISLFLSGTQALAHEAVDLTRRDGSLTIVMQYDGTPLQGGSVTLYKVGDIVEDGADFVFEWVEELHCTADVEQVQNQATANAVLKCVQEQKLTGITVQVDHQGHATFTNLSVGLYLVEEKTAAEGFERINPFLISLPQWESDHYNYNVVAAAKTERTRKDIPTPTPAPTPTPTPTTPPSPRTPRTPNTGQLNWPIPVFSGVGIVLLLIGAVLERKGKDA